MEWGYKGEIIVKMMETNEKQQERISLCGLTAFPQRLPNGGMRAIFSDSFIAGQDGSLQACFYDDGCFQSFDSDFEIAQWETTEENEIVVRFYKNGAARYFFEEISIVFLIMGGNKICALLGICFIDSDCGDRIAA